jgi:hypothetical protein
MSFDPDQRLLQCAYESRMDRRRGLLGCMGGSGVGAGASVFRSAHYTML